MKKLILIAVFLTGCIKDTKTIIWLSGGQQQPVIKVNMVKPHKYIYNDGAGVEYNSYKDTTYDVTVKEDGHYSIYNIFDKVKIGDTIVFGGLMYPHRKDSE